MITGSVGTTPWVITCPSRLRLPEDAAGSAAVQVNLVAG